jgi:outer membrane lipoprotein-sorting protein
MSKIEEGDPHMKTKFVFALCAAALLAASASAQTADELVAKNIKARGGMEKMKAIQSMKITAKMKMGPMEAPVTISKKRPENFRVEFTVQGMTGIQAYDGTTGWAVMPFMGKKDPEAMSADTLKDFKDDADFDGPMVDYKAKGNKVEYVGKEDVQGTPAYKLHVTTKDGNETNVYLDADSYLEIKTDSKRKIQGQEIESETTLGDYKDAGGVLFPMSIESHAKGREGAQSIVIEKIEINPPSIDAALFHMPEVKKPAEETKKQ